MIERLPAARARVGAARIPTSTNYLRGRWHVSVGAYVSRSRGHAFEWRYRTTSFYTSKRWLRRYNGNDRGATLTIPLPRRRAGVAHW